jgi:hypothetical protein
MRARFIRSDWTARQAVARKFAMPIGVLPQKDFNCNGYGIDSVAGHAIFRHNNSTHG